MNSMSRKELKNRAESLIELVEDFDQTLNAIYEAYFRYLFLIDTCIFCGGSDKEALEKLKNKFLKYEKKFRNFCKSKGYLRTLKKIVLTSKEKGNKKFEFVLNYHVNKTFLNRNEMRKLVEYFEKFDHKVENVVTLDYDDNNHLISKAEDLKSLVSVSNFNKVEVKRKLNTLTLVSRGINFLSSLFDDIFETFTKEVNNFELKHYNDYIMSKQENFKYKEESNKNEECAICLEEFSNGECVTKLR